MKPCILTTRQVLFGCNRLPHCSAGLLNSRPGFIGHDPKVGTISILHSVRGLSRIIRRPFRVRARRIADPNLAAEMSLVPENPTYGGL
jgi:hypothetical protein